MDSPRKGACQPVSVESNLLALPARDLVAERKRVADCTGCWGPVELVASKVQILARTWVLVQRGLLFSVFLRGLGFHKRPRGRIVTALG